MVRTRKSREKIFVGWLRVCVCERIRGEESERMYSYNEIEGELTASTSSLNCEQSFIPASRDGRDFSRLSSLQSFISP